MSIAQNDALFAIIGTTYGGNGVTTFALPDLRGRAVVGAGSGVGLTPRNVGETFGTESTTLTPANLPPPTGVSQAYSNLQPSQGLNYIIAVQGVYPSHGPGGSFDNIDPVLGEITLFAGNFAPAGWALCNGQMLPISTNTALFSILGTAFGGNGITTFALPDLRGRVALGADYGIGLNGLTSMPLGLKDGVESLSLTPDQVPLRGDVNRDGHVDGADIPAMLQALTDLNAYQTKYSLPAAATLAIGDLNGDGKVTNADLQALLTLLKSGGGSLAAVPEPASIVLLAFALAALAFAVDRRRSSQLVCRLQRRQ